MLYTNNSTNYSSIILVTDLVPNFSSISFFTSNKKIETTASNYKMFVYMTTPHYSN